MKKLLINMNNLSKILADNYREYGYHLSGRLTLNEIVRKFNLYSDNDNVIANLCSQLIHEGKLEVANLKSSKKVLYALSGTSRLQLIEQYNLITYWKEKTSNEKYNYSTMYSFEEEYELAKKNLFSAGINPDKIIINKDIVYKNIEQFYIKNGYFMSGCFSKSNLYSFIGIPNEYNIARIYDEERKYVEKENLVSKYIAEICNDGLIIYRNSYFGSYFLKGDIRIKLIDKYNLIPTWKEQNSDIINGGCSYLYHFEKELECAKNNICSRDLYD